jgi:hypothetical protein
MSEDALSTSLLAAVEANPDDVPLRVHVAEQLANQGRMTDALRHCTEAVTRSPGDPASLELLRRLSGALAGPDRAAVPSAGAPEPPAPGGADTADRSGVFDWTSAEDQVADLGHSAEATPAHDPRGGSPTVEDIERPTVRLADVGGMQQVKERLELAFLEPMRNPSMAKAFGKSLSGGLLLYGPPGCGKTFLARAVAGELGASFYSVGIADVLDMWTGSSERNLAEIFRAARRAQCTVRAVPGRDRRARAEAVAPAVQRFDAYHGQPAALRAGLRRVRQRGPVRAGRHEPAVGHRPGAAPPRAVRPDVAGAAAGRARAPRDPRVPPA